MKAFISIFTVSVRALIFLAAAVWYAGAIALLIKGSHLFTQAELLQPRQIWPWLAAISGVLIGSFKAKYLFSKSCQKNLDRIAALSHPQVWQFFRPGFLAALTIMIVVGAALSKLAHNNYLFLLGVGALDYSIATALLGSSYVFWSRKLPSS